MQKTCKTLTVVLVVLTALANASWAGGIGYVDPDLPQEKVFDLPNFPLWNIQEVSEHVSTLGIGSSGSSQKYQGFSLFTDGLWYSTSKNGFTPWEIMRLSRFDGDTLRLSFADKEEGDCFTPSVLSSLATKFQGDTLSIWCMRYCPSFEQLQALSAFQGAIELMFFGQPTVESLEAISSFQCDTLDIMLHIPSGDTVGRIANFKGRELRLDVDICFDPEVWKALATFGGEKLSVSARFTYHIRQSPAVNEIVAFAGDELEVCLETCEKNRGIYMESFEAISRSNAKKLTVQLGFQLSPETASYAREFVQILANFQGSELTLATPYKVNYEAIEALSGFNGKVNFSAGGVYPAKIAN